MAVFKVKERGAGREAASCREELAAPAETGSAPDQRRME